MVYKYCNDQSINIFIVVNITSMNHKNYRFKIKKQVVIWLNKIKHLFKI